MSIGLFAMAAQAAGNTSTDPGSVGYMASMLVSLLVVLAVAIGLAWLWKRVMPRNLLNQTGVEILSTRHIGSRERLLVVKVGERYLLLGATPQSIQTLAELKQDELPNGLNAQQKEPQQKWPFWQKQDS